MRDYGAIRHRAHAAAGDVPEGILRATRGWPAEAWDGAVDSLRVRGWLEQGDELRFTPWGEAQRQALEEGPLEVRRRHEPYGASGNEDDARDVVQEAYLRAYRGLRRFRGDAQFTTWLYRITANCSANLLAKRARV